jgi:hypothetical protein
VAGDAAILRYLAAHEFPAERCAADEPVSDLDGRSVLVTGWADPVPRQQRWDAIRAAAGLSHLGALLGRLHTLDAVPAAGTGVTPAAGTGGMGMGDGAVARPGGAWHHLADGLPSAEIAAASQMLAEATPLIPDTERAAFDALRAEVAALDAAEGLPEALIHPDFVLANVVATPGGCGAAWLPRARDVGTGGTRPPRRSPGPALSSSAPGRCAWARARRWRP